MTRKRIGCWFTCSADRLDCSDSLWSHRGLAAILPSDHTHLQVCTLPTHRGVSYLKQQSLAFRDMKQWVSKSIPKALGSHQSGDWVAACSINTITTHQIRGAGLIWALTPGFHQKIILEAPSQTQGDQNALGKSHSATSEL